ncbi:MAG: hypothetical protein GY930_02065 [bacterium]|nr:hypothetical protein [bacterium]
MVFPHYAHLVPLLKYPTDALPQQTAWAIKAFEEDHAEAAEHLKAFADMLPWGAKVAGDACPLQDQEEIYTRSFEIQAITTLDLGYILFGDEYKRAEVLVNLNREHEQNGVDCGRELSDHLSNILALLSRSEDRDMLGDLVAMILAPAMRMMVGEFTPARIEAKEAVYRRHHKTLIDKDSVRSGMYGHVLNAVYCLLQKDFNFAEEEVIQDFSADFLSSISRELEIESEEEKPQGQFEPPVTNMPGTGSGCGSN